MDLFECFRQAFANVATRLKVKVKSLNGRPGASAQSSRSFERTHGGPVFLKYFKNQNMGSHLKNCHKMCLKERTGPLPKRPFLGQALRYFWEGTNFRAQ